MEIAILPQSSLRIKGKQATLGVDPHDKAPYNATILLGETTETAKIADELVIINGHGEYEVAGIKMTGTRNDGKIHYSMHVDGIEILLGKINALDKMQHKLKEHNIVIVLCDEVGNASFLTSLATNVVIFYGQKAAEIAQAFGKDNMKTQPKFSVTRDKLPQEVETIILE
jgi:hypothetical protein